MQLTEADKAQIRLLLKKQAVIHARKAAERHWCGGRLVRDARGAFKCNRCGEKQAEGGAQKGAGNAQPRSQALGNFNERRRPWLTRDRWQSAPAF